MEAVIRKGNKAGWREESGYRWWDRIVERADLNEGSKQAFISMLLLVACREGKEQWILGKEGEG